MKRTRKISYFILCFILITAILGAIIFVNENAQHVCSGHECSICLQLHHAQQLLQNIGGNGQLRLLGIVLSFLLSTVYLKKLLLNKKTLITLKVELLD